MLGNPTYNIDVSFFIKGIVNSFDAITLNEKNQSIYTYGNTCILKCGFQGLFIQSSLHYLKENFTPF